MRRKDKTSFFLIKYQIIQICKGFTKGKLTKISKLHPLSEHTKRRLRRQKNSFLKQLLRFFIHQIEYLYRRKCANVYTLHLQSEYTKRPQDDQEQLFKRAVKILYFHNRILQIEQLYRRKCEQVYKLHLQNEYTKRPVRPQRTAFQNSC